MSQSRFFWTEPALCHYNYDLTRAWFVSFSFTDTITGAVSRQQHRANINQAKTKDARIRLANAVIKRWKTQLEAGWNPFIKDGSKKMPINYSIVEALEAILKIKLPSLKKKTKQTYTYVVNLFKKWLEENSLSFVPCAQITKQQMSQYMDSLITEKKYSGRTHNDHLIVLATLFNAMISREWIIKSPTKGIERRETSVGRNIAFTDNEKEELKKLLKKEDPQLYYFTQIMYFTFIRRTELARLTVGDFDLINKTIVIPSHVSKNGIQESVVIPIGLEAILKEMKLEHYPTNNYVFGRHLFISDIVYENVNHISTRHLKFVKKLKIHTSKSLYSWKHSGVCAAYYATGKDLYAIMRQCRHRSIETTQVYLKSLGLIQNDVFRNAMVA